MGLPDRVVTQTDALSLPGYSFLFRIPVHGHIMISFEGRHHKQEIILRGELFDFDSDAGYFLKTVDIQDLDFLVVNFKNFQFLQAAEHTADRFHG